MRVLWHYLNRHLSNITSDSKENWRKLGNRRLTNARIFRHDCSQEVRVSILLGNGFLGRDAGVSGHPQLRWWTLNSAGISTWFLQCASGVTRAQRPWYLFQMLQGKVHTSQGPFLYWQKWQLFCFIWKAVLTSFELICWYIISTRYIVLGGESEFVWMTTSKPSLPNKMLVILLFS